ncbi:dihydrolipoamide acetyltransferase family protein [Tepidibacillus infernus]|uniref:Dihydrolipoamide acetyltransferase component of pyruvate dehydrogenase complex n=1 Tax=Tepidibacillus decaturensis TaxID=1413211 RepID=A0A135L339_9BACI|nr:dihydrolipoamide acetyltransferase family protein [Tepidibacillus decaturensis]KXG43317.1 branched-chain alpha-keto acid dehydrogenase subunit E2 [Tepidibacillus decaturensis]
MATKVLMPQLGESVTEGTITKWLKKVGEQVALYEPLCEVETDKVNAEVPATVAGIVTEIAVEEGTTIAVGHLICYIQEDEAISPESIDGIEQTLENPVQSEIVQSKAQPNENQGIKHAGKIRYSPAVMRLAQENNIDFTRIKGTGLEGRITRKDVLQYIENNNKQEVLNDSPSMIESAELTTGSNVDFTSPIIQTTPISNGIDHGDQVMKVNTVRRTIAKRMVQSKHEAPHAWLTVEADVTELVNYRNSIKKELIQKEGFNLTFLPFFIKAVVESIKEYPILNSVWDEDQIILKKNINISIAVATEDALFVPVIHDADQKSIYGLAKQIDQLVKKTKAGKLTMDDMQGGTFTVNNTGAIGSVLSAPIINHPQAGIITMESIVKRPVVIEDMLAIRSMVNLCMSFDHRIIDGFIAGRFIQNVKSKLESLGKNKVSIY